MQKPKNQPNMNITLIKEELHYQTGDRVTNKELKATLQRLYDKYQIKEKAKATHILNFGYLTKKCKIRIGDKRVDGLELYSIN
mgnify:CR=1 FL=1